MTHSRPAEIASTDDASSRRLLQVITELLGETGSASRTPRLDSDLERDLGLDSLSRNELLTRLEREFQVTLPEQALLAATPDELLQSVLTAAGLGAPAGTGGSITPQVPVAAADGDDHTLPEQARTLVDVLNWHAERHPQRQAIVLYEDGEEPYPISYAELRQGAREVATGLRGRGIQPGQTVAIMLPSERGYFFSFYGILLAGATPVPIYPPARPNQIEDHLHRHAGILVNAQCRLLITIPRAKLVARLLRAQVDTLNDIATVSELRQPAGNWIDPPLAGDDIAFLQYTSGSTGDPKGVVLTHANLLANIRALIQRLEAGPGDVFVSWLPLYHDMGLIGACLGSLYCGIPLVAMSPLRFLRRPLSWLRAIHQHRGTLSAAPNFAYELCLRHIQDADLAGLDLSSWRLAFNGAEPVSAATMHRFAERFAVCGFRSDALAPVYGLAECSVGLAIPVPGRGLKVDVIERERFARDGEAVAVSGSGSVTTDSATTDSATTIEIIACGHVLNGHEMRVVDSDGQELPQRREGRLQFKGPSATRGYLNNPAATKQLFSGDWLETGDRAYIASGDLYLTGRVKDMIIRGGRNIYPYELEQAVGDIAGVRKGCVAVFASRNESSATETLIVVAETREREPQQLEELRERIGSCSVDILGTPADDIVLAPPHSVLKTSSGKIRRNAIRDLYQQGTLGQSSHGMWWQLARVGLTSIRPQLRRGYRRLGAYLFAAYVWILFPLLALIAWAGVLLLPGAAWRWRFCRFIGALALRLTGTTLSVDGLQHLPPAGQPCIVTANHASYLDAIILATALPRVFRFVAKRELGNSALLRPMLERLGVILVERFDIRQTSADTEKTLQAALAGDSLAFFPEATFGRTPGLLPFRLGAFVAAARAGTPVIPVILKGTRAMLLGDTWFPRRAVLSVSVNPAITADGDDWQAAVQLRDRVRAVMLEQTGEPDLSHQDNPLLKKS